MKRTSSPRSSVDHPYGSASANENSKGSDASVHEEKKGYVHLLKNHTPDDIAKLPVGDPMQRSLNLGRFLRDGALPESLVVKSVMAEWLLEHREPDVFLAMLDLGPISINLDNEQRARTLLQIARSTQPISGLEIQVSSSPHDALPGQTLPLLVEAIKLDKGLDTFSIYGNNYHRRGLSPLLDALDCVRNLKLTTMQCELGPDDVMSLANLVSKNKKIKVLDLSFRMPELVKEPFPFPGAMNLLLAGLGAQSGLEQLGLAGLPRDCQGVLAEFIGKSRALTSLNISLHGPDATESLVTGLRQNTTLRHLTLDVGNIEDGMLPLITLLAEKKSCPAQFVLETRNGRKDRKDSLLIGEMIASNTTMSAFTWHFRDHTNVDLLLLGSALQVNTTLDTIALGKTGSTHGEADVSTDWVDQGQLPGLVALLGKNRTLTKFNFVDRHYPSAVRPTRPEIEEIMGRNLSYQRYVCSDEFIEGAARGFFHALNMPSELGQVTARYLLEQNPRIETAALALVDKATYAWALDSRREKGAKVTKDALAAAERHDGDAADRMIALLKRIVATPQDFSDDALREIAGSPFIAPAMVSIMDSSPPDYDDLVTRLGEAAGVGLIRMLVMMEIRRQQEMAMAPNA